MSEITKNIPCASEECCLVGDGCHIFHVKSLCGTETLCGWPEFKACGQSCPPRKYRMLTATAIGNGADSENEPFPPGAFNCEFENQCLDRVPNDEQFCSGETQDGGCEAFLMRTRNRQVAGAGQDPSGTAQAGRDANGDCKILASDAEFPQFLDDEVNTNCCETFTELPECPQMGGYELDWRDPFVVGENPGFPNVAACDEPVDPGLGFYWQEMSRKLTRHFGAGEDCGPTTSQRGGGEIEFELSDEVTFDDELRRNECPLVACNPETEQGCIQCGENEYKKYDTSGGCRVPGSSRVAFTTSHTPDSCSASDTITGQSVSFAVAMTDLTPGQAYRLTIKFLKCPINSENPPSCVSHKPPCVLDCAGAPDCDEYTEQTREIEFTADNWTEILAKSCNECDVKTRKAQLEAEAEAWNAENTPDPGDERTVGCTQLGDGLMEVPIAAGFYMVLRGCELEEIIE